MTASLIGSLIAVAGMLVSIVALLTQRSTSLAAIRAETQRLADRIAGEEGARIREKRWDQLVDALSELMAVSDPQISPTIDYGRAVTLIHRIDLLLDTRVPEQRALSISAGRLGLTLQEYAPRHALPHDEKAADISALLKAQSAMVEGARIVLHARDGAGSTLRTRSIVPSAPETTQG